jgi:hypothetical protein
MQFQTFDDLNCDLDKIAELYITYVKDSQK